MQSHQYGAGTDIGNARDNNEDTYVCAIDKELWIVADGMGGLGFGEVASAISAYTVTSLIKQGHGVNQAIEVAHQKIKDYAQREASGTNMGTTLVLLLSQGNIYNVFWVGDSRGYLFNGSLTQITRDHSLVQNLVDQGELTEEEAQFDPRKNAITKALGVQELDTVRADSVSGKWHVGEKILLCSDGLTDCVLKQDIEQILQEDGSDQHKVNQLIEKALAEGGKDNITVILVSAPESISKPESDTEVPMDDEETEPEEGDESAKRDNSDTHVIAPRNKKKRSGPARSEVAPDQLPLSLPINESPEMPEGTDVASQQAGPRPEPEHASEQVEPDRISPALERDNTDPVYISAGYVRPPKTEAEPQPAPQEQDTTERTPRASRMSLKFLLPIAAAVLLFLVWTGIPLDRSVVTPPVSLAQEALGTSVQMLPEAEVREGTRAEYATPAPQQIAMTGLASGYAASTGSSEKESSETESPETVDEDLQAQVSSLASLSDSAGEPDLDSMRPDGRLVPSSGVSASEILANVDTLFQLGIFSRQAGAEVVVTDLGKLGLQGWIEDRPEASGTQYAVLLGPFEDDEHEAHTAATLRREKIAYFRKFLPESE